LLFASYVVVTDNEEEGVNVAVLIGNLATDVDLREIGDDKRVAKFLLAVDRYTKEGGADFIWVSAWDRQADLCSQYLTKGQRVGVDGRFRSRTWEEEGKRRDAIEVVARSVQFLSTRGADAGGEVVPFEAAVA
jgi:single-strand DNA-binding protein